MTANFRRWLWHLWFALWPLLLGGLLALQLWSMSRTWRWALSGERTLDALVAVLLALGTAEGVRAYLHRRAAQRKQSARI